MKKMLFYASLLLLLSLHACMPAKYTIGRNTVETISFETLFGKLERDQYEIHENITAEAEITVTKKTNTLYTVQEANGEFLLEISLKGESTFVNLKKGVLKFGYLANDAGTSTRINVVKGKNQASLISEVPADPETIARRLAKYRLIREAKNNGADCLVDPIIASDIAVSGKKVTVIKTTITAKPITLKTDKQAE